MYDASNRADVRRAEKASALADQNRREVLAALASTEPGRRYLWDRVAELHVFTSVFNESPTRMAFLEGERNAGLALLNDFMSAAPDQFIQAMREANGRRTADDARRTPSPDNDRRERPGDEGRDGDDQGPSGED